MNRPINILVLVRDRVGGVGYYRSLKPHTYIADKYGNEFNIDIDYVIPNTNLSSYYAKYDIIHFHKVIDPEGVTLKLLKDMGKITVCDIDDYWMLGSHHPMGLVNARDKAFQPIIDHISKADYVTTTTPIFADRIRQFNKNVVVIPNAIDITEEQFIPNPVQHDKLRIGLICGSTHGDDVDLLSSISYQIKPEVREKIQFVLCGFDTNGRNTLLNKKTGERKVVEIDPKDGVWARYERVITNDYKLCSPEYARYLKQYINVPYQGDENKEYYLRRWTKPIDKYATHYNDIDVLLAPLVECDFAKYKSQLKAIEAGVFNKVLIAQNFGPYTVDLKNADAGNGVIDYTANALLVDSRKNNKNWSKYITWVVQNEELRNALRTNLHNTVMEKYTLDKVTETRIDFYKRICDGRESFNSNIYAQE